MAWAVILLDEVEAWYLDVVKRDPETGDLIAAAIDLLAEEGPTLGRPVVDKVKGAKRHNMKELRPGSSGQTEVRVLFIFDPQRQAVLLVGGDKSGSWSRWYDDNIAVADERYDRWLAGDYKNEG